MSNTDQDVSIVDIIECLPSLNRYHSRSSAFYKIFEKVARASVSSSNLKKPLGVINLGGFGEIVFPYTEMGAINSLNLFDLDELIIFSFYWANRGRYRRVADLGANLGLHSILMSRCGWQVQAYEPDPYHFSVLRQNLELNQITGVTVREAAVSDKEGVLEFVRVLGNTTSSHLSGAKRPYGPLERFSVKVESVDNIFSTSDFIKMDVEGEEGKIILSTEAYHWKNTDMILEVGSKENAISIFDHASKLEVNLFSQKHNWNMVSTLDDMPFSYKEGSLFISQRPSMPWEDC